jgi:hypothetical protein
LAGENITITQEGKMATKKTIKKAAKGKGKGKGKGRTTKAKGKK